MRIQRYFQTLKKFRKSKRKFRFHRYNPQSIKLNQKCFRNYLTQCLFSREETFYIKFKCRYRHNFFRRVLDWFEYYMDIFKLFWIKNLKSNKANTPSSYMLLKCGAIKPIHVKTFISVSESLLERVLKENGFKIENEELTSLHSIYYICRI